MILKVMMAWFAGMLTATAMTFSPEAAPEMPIRDGKTIALYKVDSRALGTREIPDVTGRAAAGKIAGNWTVGPNGDGLQTGEPSSGQTAEIVFPGIQPFDRGSFTVDLVMRWGDGQGHVLRVGSGRNALVMGVLHRGPGLFELRVPVKTETGGVEERVFSSKEIYRDVGPARPTTFYTYSLSFDGKRTFGVFIDGKRVFEATLGEKERCAASGALAVGNVASWASAFVGGEIAWLAVRDEAKPFTQSQDKKITFSQTSGSWVFAAGMPRS